MHNHDKGKQHTVVKNETVDHDKCAIMTKENDKQTAVNLEICSRKRVGRSMISRKKTLTFCWAGAEMSKM